MTTNRLTRNMLDRVLGGVCGGIGAYLGVSGWWIRLGFIALTLVSLSFGILAYLLLWMLIPGQGLDDLPPIPQFGQPPVLRYARPETMLILGMGVIIIGAVLLAQSAGLLQGPQGDLLGPGLLVLIALVLLVKHLRGRP
ncbi:MAG: PspC domain-containing protein [Chloroflexota bacterium]